MEILYNYNAEKQINQMKQLPEYALTEQQFAQLLGRARMYQYLPKKEKQNLPLFSFNDSQLNTITKDYYEDDNFCREDNGYINLWKLHSLLTQANKSSYIDTFLDRNANAFDFAGGILKALNGSSSGHHWFLS